jgi:hypothetical protein
LTSAGPPSRRSFDWYGRSWINNNRSPSKT